MEAKEKELMGRGEAVGVLAAVAASYAAAFIYARWCVIGLGGVSVRFAYPAFTAVFIACVECAARMLGRKAPGWHWFWAACFASIAAATAAWGFHPLPIGAWEFFAWHAFAIYWALVRTGMLGDGRSGIMLPLDFFIGIVTGVANMFLSVTSFFRALVGLRGKATLSDLKKASGIIISLAIAAGVCLIAWILLALGDSKFSAFTGDLFVHAVDALERLFKHISGTDVVAALFAIPVGAWLFGFVAGCLGKDGPMVKRTDFDAVVGAGACLPQAAAVTVPLSLLAVYLIFFGVQTADFFTAVSSSEPMVAQRACTYAVDGFWYLFWIMILDFAVLGSLHYLCRNVSGERLAIRLLLAAFLVAGLAIGLLGGWKLWYYIQLGLTPRRMLSAWFLTVMMAWNVLALVRIFVPFLAVRWAVCVLGGAFAALCALPVAQICRL